MQRQNKTKEEGFERSLMLNYDIIIVGGGLVGAGLAAALRESSLRIALIDARLPTQDDHRLFALNYYSCQFLRNIGLWPELKDVANAIHQVHVSYHKRFGAIRFTHRDVNLSTLGYVIPARYIEKALNEMLAQSKITMYRPAVLTDINQTPQQASITLEINQKTTVLNASIVVAADGTHSTIRKILALPTKTMDYQQSAMVSMVSLSRSHHHIAYERLYQQGAIAMLPLNENRCAMIWTASHSIIAELMMLSNESFLNALQNQFGYRLGRFTGIEQRHRFPLQMVKIDNQIDQCVFFMGNAAHTLHPIAAQGFNLSLYEVATFVEGVTHILSENKSLTAQSLYPIYQQTQKQQDKSMRISHRLSQLSTSDFSLTNLIVQFGMLSLDMLVPFRKKLIKELIGSIALMPRLLLSMDE